MSETVADVIVSVLQEARVSRCYGLPGDTLNYVTDAIRRSAIRFVHVRHEEVGGFAAGADALLTGNLAACAGSCGPGLLEHDNPFAVGMTGVFGAEGRTMKECDTLLLLGCDFAWRQFYPDKAKIIQLDIDGAHLGRRHPVDLAVVGDVAATLDALLPKISTREDRAFLDDMLACHRKAITMLDKRARIGKGGAIHPQYLADLIARHAQPDAVLTADGGSPMVWLLRHVPATGCNRTVVSLTHGTMAQRHASGTRRRGRLSKPAGYFQATAA